MKLLERSHVGRGHSLGEGGSCGDRYITVKHFKKSNFFAATKWTDTVDLSVAAVMLRKMLKWA
jgi:hypothetical protein